MMILKKQFPSSNLRWSSPLLLAAVLLTQACGGGSYNGGNGGGGGGSAPSAPTGLTATAQSQQVSLAWTASSGATSYHVKRGTTTGGPYTQVATPATASYVDAGLTNGTAYYYVVSAVNSYGESANSSQAVSTPVATTTNVQVTVDVLANRHPISPYIYGTNFPNDANYISDSGTTMVRWGGNASTRYNWMNFDTSAAADYYFVNRPMGSAPLYSDSTQFVSNVKAAGGFPLMTIGMLPWVAKDASSYSFSVSKYGAQCQSNPGNSDDGDGIKPGANCLNSKVYVTGNDPKDAHVALLDQPGGSDPAGSVYRNQWVAALAAQFGASPHFYDMDNEYDIWDGTHRDVHPNPTTYQELRDTFVNESRAVKTWDPLAIRFGPVSCCWYFYWNSALGSSDKAAHGGVDFLPWWVNEVAWMDSQAGTHSLDAFDAHAYPEANTSSLTTAQAQALALRVPRDWWDPTYTSEAWFGSSSASQQQPLDTKPFRIPRLRAMLNTIYPGTPLSFTEWNFAMAGELDFSTALADADAWGILGRERVTYSTRWTAADPASPAYNSLKLYRNYDGAHHTFGTTSVSATHNADPNLFSSYAAVDAAGTTLTMMVVNKDPASAVQVAFALNGFTPASVVSYTLAATAPTTIKASSSAAWSSTMTFAPYTATLLVISGTTTTIPAAEWDLNPDTIMVPAGGTVVLQPKITSGAATVTLSSPTFDSGIIGAVLTQPVITATQKGTITITAGTAPGFYHFSVSGNDGTATQTQGGWVVVGNPASTLAKTGDPGSGTHGTPITLIVTLTPGASGGAATGASIFFTTDAGSLSQRIVTTDSAGVASVTLTLPVAPGTVHVTAEGPYGLGHPIATFTETSN